MTRFGPPATSSAMRFASVSVAVVVLSSVGSLTACETKIASIDITPPKVELKADNESKQLSATPKDKDGTAIEDERVAVWKSADPAVATVTATGLLKPAGSGSTTVTATIEEVSASVPVSVVLVKRMQLPSPAMVLVAGVPSEALTVNFMNERGERIEMDAKVRWKTSDPAIATVTDAGVVTGVVAGSTLLTAEAKELKAEMTVTVNPAPEAVPVPVPAPEPTK